MEAIKRFVKKHHTPVVAAVALILAAVMLLSVLNTQRISREQAAEIGRMRVENIEAGLQLPLSRAQGTLDRLAVDVEAAIALNELNDLPLLLSGIRQRESTLSGGDCLNVFAVTGNKLVMADAEIPAGYVYQDRPWYRGLLANGADGSSYISAAYENLIADYGMSYTAARFLSDGETIVGAHFRVQEIQNYVSGLHSDGYGDVMIADSNGTVVGAMNAALVGRRLSDVGIAYQDAFLRADSAGSGNTDIQMGTVGDATIFCGRTNSDWYVLCTISNSFLYRDNAGQVLRALVAVLLVGAVIVLGLMSMRHQKAAVAVRETASSGENASASHVYDSAAARRKKRFNLKPVRFVDENDTEEMTAVKQRNYRLGMLAVFLVALGILLAVSTLHSVRITRERMDYDLQSYKETVSGWVDEQSSILHMFANVLTARPDLLEDYDGMVRFLDSVTRRYPSISATYVANLNFSHGHQLVMNNGWQPGPDYDIQKRPWYISAVNDASTNISEPYTDERTGGYCITFSRAMISESGENYGVFAIDYYFDTLLNIISESYTGTGYAFLADRNGLIIDHPNVAYNLNERLHNLIYAKLFRQQGVVRLRDYDGKLKVAASVTEPSSGLRVVVVKDWWSAYSDIFVYGGVYTLLIAVCILVVNLVMNALNRWQQQTNMNLKEAADSAIMAERGKTQFLSNISHELRTPINAVLGMNEMILREAKDEQIRSYALNIQSSGKTLLFLINDILDMSRIESGKMKIVPVQYDPGELVADLWNVHYLRAQEKGLRLSFSVDENVPRTLYGDDVRIKQIITNLLTNAVKYTHKGGIDLRMSYSNTGFKMVSLIVSVKDTGIGIRKEDMGKLFESFQRLEEEKNRNIEGAGLGMSIVMSLLKQMGGDLRVESEYQKGTTFTVSIPQRVIDAEPTGDFETIRRRQQQEMAQELEQKAFQAPEAEIMVVDDNEMNIAVFKALLNRTKIKITSANSGMACLELVEQQPYHMIFMDHMMPEMDGVETLRAIKKLTDCPNLETPVVALTANAQSGAKEEYIQLGFTDFLTKPIDAPQLERMIRKYLPAELVQDVEETVEEKPAAVAVVDKYDQYGISMEQGLHYSTGNMDVYMDLVEMFVRDKERRQKLERFMSEGNMKDYSILAHSLKGNARTLGAQKLADEAYEHEKESKADNASYVLAHWDKLIELWEATKDGLCLLYQDQRGVELTRDAAPTEETAEDANISEGGDAIEITHEDLQSVAALIDNFESEKAVAQLKSWLKQPLHKDVHDRIKAALVALEDEFDEGRAMKLLKE